MAAKNASERLTSLRLLMASRGVDAYIIPTADCHNSEYPVNHYARRQYITGFDGSAGTAVVTADSAMLWTDGRYFLQAEGQLDNTCWTLMKDGLPDTPSILTWLIQNANQIKSVGADGHTYSVSAWRDLVASNKVQFVPTKGNLVDEVWNNEPESYRQPPLPFKPITVHPIELAGVSVADKLKCIRGSMQPVKGSDPVDALVLTETPEVAWMFNLRGTDFKNCGMFLSFAIITQDEARLYCCGEKLTQESLEQLQQNRVDVRPYQSLVDDLVILSRSLKPDGCRMKFNMDNNVCLSIYEAIPDSAHFVVTRINPVAKAKAKKNDAEIKCFIDAHISDAVALCTYLAWLERSATDGTLWNETEYSTAVYLKQLRLAQPTCLGLSFTSISSMNENGAVIHYRPLKTKSKPMTPGIYLIDSGGQYRGATTDVTRTVVFGEPTPFQKECYTRVLKGHIALARAVFPTYTKGPQLDVLARIPIWSAGLNYLHGTGHGVGAQLSVHEGPCSIGSSLKGAAAETDLDVGMVLSNEPGYYLDGHFGFRIENLVFVKTSDKTTNTISPGAKPNELFMEFEDLTVVPYCRQLIDVSILSKEEEAWINCYHANVHKLILPLIKDSVTKAWLIEATERL